MNLRLCVGNRSRRGFLLSTLCVAAAVCTAFGCGAAEFEAVSLSPQEGAEARLRIVQWLECEECVAGELDAVKALDSVAVPPLRAALEVGPSPASIEEERYALKQNFHSMVDSGFTPIGDADDLADRYLSNYRAKYRIRAAIALGEIGGKEAQSALQEASQIDDHRDDVTRAIAESLNKLNQASQ